MPNRSPIYRALIVVTLLVWLLGGAPAIAAPALSEVEGAAEGSEVEKDRALGGRSAEAATGPRTSLPTGGHRAGGHPPIRVPPHLAR
jgi:hypothetical protein